MKLEKKKKDTVLILITKHKLLNAVGISLINDLWIVNVVPNKLSKSHKLLLFLWTIWSQEARLESCFSKVLQLHFNYLEVFLCSTFCLVKYLCLLTTILASFIEGIGSYYYNGGLFLVNSTGRTTLQQKQHFLMSINVSNPSENSIFDGFLTSKGCQKNTRQK